LQVNKVKSTKKRLKNVIKYSWSKEIVLENLFLGAVMLAGLALAVTCPPHSMNHVPVTV